MTRTSHGVSYVPCAFAIHVVNSWRPPGPALIRSFGVNGYVLLRTDCPEYADA